jgi:hypothetical protein
LRSRITGTIKKSAPEDAGIRFEMGHFDHHPARFTRALGADMNAYHPPGREGSNQNVLLHRVSAMA